MLGEAGATVYCTGRSSRETGGPGAGVYAGRPERIEDTAAMVDAAGGRGIAVRVDHAAAAEVAALAERVASEHGGLDLLVIDFWGDYAPVAFGTPFWEIPEAAARTTLEGTLWPHLLTLRALVPLLQPRPPRRRPPLVVEVAEGAELHYRGQLFYDLAAARRLRLTYALAEELAPRGIVVVGVARATCAPSMRSTLRRHRGDVARGGRPAMRDGCSRNRRRSSAGPSRRWPAIPRCGRWAGRTYGSWELARDYGIDDLDGTRPDFGSYFREHVGESPLPAKTRPAGTWVTTQEGDGHDTQSAGHVTPGPRWRSSAAPAGAPARASRGTRRGRRHGLLPRPDPPRRPAADRRRPGSIDDTADEVTARGGRGIAVATDCTDEAQVAAAFAQVERDHGGLDVLANAVWGGHDAFRSADEWMASMGRPFWERAGQMWAATMDAGPRAYLLASAQAARLMTPRKRGLIAGLTDFVFGDPEGAQERLHAGHAVPGGRPRLHQPADVPASAREVKKPASRW